MRRIKNRDTVDVALGAGLLTVLLLVLTDAPMWLALLGPVGVAVSVLDSLDRPDDEDGGTR